MDPLSFKFTWQSTYTAFDNNPISLVDRLGSETEGGPGDGYTKNKDGSRSKTNANGTKTYDAPGFSSVNLPANAKVLGTMQDVDGNKDGAIYHNNVKYEASVGDLAKFEVDDVEYTAQFSQGKFTGYLSYNGDSYDDEFGSKSQSKSSDTEINLESTIKTTEAFSNTNELKSILIDYASKTGNLSEGMATYIKASKVLGLASSVVTTSYSGYKVSNQFQKGGIKNIDGWDAADLVVGSAGIVATAVTILSTNPAGWVIIATGATIYGGFRFGYQIYTE